MTRTILVTGGAGYIGSHTCVELIANGFDVIVVDNLSNSSATALERVGRIAGRNIALHPVDLTDRAALTAVFKGAHIDAVIHFAGLKAVGESVKHPLRYFHNNLTGTINLLQVMSDHQVKELVFSSSATVYGDPSSVPITEDSPLQVTNPYGRSKLVIEDMLRDLSRAGEGWRIIALRYFNPVGAHPSGLIGEDPVGTPNNLMPYIMQVAVGRRPHLTVFGSDYPTPDGTGMRDYIHVVDLALGHVAALGRIGAINGCEAFNLGTGRGYTVLEVLKAASRACGHDIPCRMAPRRPGDAAICYADPSRAARELGWKAQLDLDRMCADSWRWQSSNPEGYQASPGSAKPGVR